MDECLKSEQAANPDAGKEGSVLNLGIIMIPGCVFVLANKHKCAHRHTHTLIGTLTSIHECTSELFQLLFVSSSNSQKSQDQFEGKKLISKVHFGHVLIIKRKFNPNEYNTRKDKSYCIVVAKPNTRQIQTSMVSEPTESESSRSMKC